MSQIHLNQIETFLVDEYSQHIHLEDNLPKNKDDVRNYKLSRSLAAFSLKYLYNIDAPTAANHITDGYNDNGIDLIYFKSDEKTLVLTQSKWSNNPDNSVDSASIQKFIQGIKDLTSLNFDNFNDKIKVLRPQLEEILWRQSDVKIKAVLIYSGKNQIHTEQKRLLDHLERDFNDITETLEIIIIKQDNIHAYLRSEKQATAINSMITLYNFGKGRGEYDSIYGQIESTTLCELYEKFGNILFSPNIRQFLGNTNVNQTIESTIKNSPNNFWYFNNGITALTSEFFKTGAFSQKNDIGVFDCKNFQIVNGAQTVGSLYKAYANYRETLSDIYVQIRIISLKGCPDDFGREITKSNNTQNRVEIRDFVSLDPNQERIRTELELDGIIYSYKSGDKITDTKKAFDLEEASIALACHNEDSNLSVISKSYISGLWEDIKKDPYKKLFSDTIDGRTVWNIVQLQRQINTAIHAFRPNTRKKREQAILLHGTRTILHICFKMRRNKKYERKNFNELVPRIVELIDKSINSRYKDSYVANIFKNRDKCRNIVNDVISNY